MKTLKIGLSALSILLLLNGCGASSQNLQSQSIGGTRVTNYFHTGYVDNVNKVLISRTNKNVLGAALGGAILGAIIGRDVKGALIGGGVGAVAGGVGGEMTGNNEDVSYETTIISNGYRYMTHLDYELRVGTPVEFTLEDNQISNINVKKRY